MRWVSVVQASVVAGVAAATFALVSGPPVTGQARTSNIPRLNGKPDLNGIWQAINTANWDIQAHSAKPALAMRPGPVVPVPAKEVLAFGAVGVGAERPRRRRRRRAPVHARGAARRSRRTRRTG